MSFKKHIMMGMATGLVGMALISGGTVAYFTDSVDTQNEIMSGTLDLGVTNIDDGVLFEFKNKQPGDVFDYKFNLSNNGTLEIGEVTLISNHTVDGKADFGSQIEVVSLTVDGEEKITSDKKVTLDDLKGAKNAKVLLNKFPEDSQDVEVFVKFKFIQTKESQNDYQGNVMDLNWTFEAKQVIKEK
ncbi:TasA family protein [Oceanobacillus sp. Castelsardo]|uniref:TasA family protein n=1 Tax=Oceanobacillus sp. Castelsardo TaxID=1851204 RepID=UPI00083850F0|nr:TasA family protein [Oceanobacillus sp. Castelsardo]